jgi:transglutaminase/protease-like cytokinesis protein 3
MRFLLSILFMCIVSTAGAQSPGYSNIDWRAGTIDAPTPDSLAKLLIAPYSRDIEKVRAIFSWVAQHISYNSYVISSSQRRNGSSRYSAEPEDTAIEWKSAIEMTAIKVLKKRTAVCDGYAKLFKTLCDHAGLHSEIISGYARGYMQGERKFSSNHSWNAIMIDSVWHLLDVTWASGYFTYADQYVQRMDDTYFLTPPDQFIRDHYPEDLYWTLMENPPSIPEFRKMPFHCKSFVKYSIGAVSPSNGIVEAYLGDTVHIEINITNKARDKHISPDPFFDSSIIDRAANEVYLTATDSTLHTLKYSFHVGTPNVQWINVMYNNDVIMRYRLELKSALAARIKECARD